MVGPAFTSRGSEKEGKGKRKARDIFEYIYMLAKLFENFPKVNVSLPVYFFIFKDFIFF